MIIWQRASLFPSVDESVYIIVYNCERLHRNVEASLA